MTNRSLQVVAVTAAVVISSLFLSASSSANEEEKKEETKVDVFVSKVKPESVHDSIKYGGFAQSDNVRELFTPVEGHLEKVYVKLGQQVKKGEKLYTINPNVAGALYQPQVMRAPTSGVVTYIITNHSTRVKKGEPIVRIAREGDVYVRIHVTYEDMVFIKESKPVVEVVAHSGSELEKKYQGEVFAISPAADPVTSSFAIDLKVENPQNQLPLGSYLEANVHKNVRQSIVIPITALNNKRDKVFVVVKDNIIESRKITLGKYFAESVEVLEGLKAGETLVTKYAERPKKGDIANIQTPKERNKKIDAAANKTDKSRG